MIGRVTTYKSIYSHSSLNRQPVKCTGKTKRVSYRLEEYLFFINVFHYLLIHFKIQNRKDF